MSIDQTDQSPATETLLLDVRGLCLGTGEGSPAVEGLSFAMRTGQTLCLVGEAGAGKTIISRALVRVLDVPVSILGGEILFQCPRGECFDLAGLDVRGRAWRNIRGREVSMIFQESLSAFSPGHSIGEQLLRTLRELLGLGKREAQESAITLLKRVEIPDPASLMGRYAFECSAGVRQRAMIAMALACEPKLLIADEPTRGLDLSTQAEILSLLKRLQLETGMALLLMTRDMDVAAEMADQVGFLKAGHLVELGSADEVFGAPKEDYTRSLIETLASRAFARERQAYVPSGRKLMEAHSLTKIFSSRSAFPGVRSGVSRRALDKVSFDLYEGECLGIVGETGSGKTTLRDCLVRLQAPSSGELLYRLASGLVVNLSEPDRDELREARREIRLLFRDPMAAFNPHLKIGSVLIDALPASDRNDDQTRAARLNELLDWVGLGTWVLDAYPQVFTPAQLQRIAIARALATRPRLIIADQPTSMLEPTERADLLDLLLGLQTKFGLSLLFICSDISEAFYCCDRIAVMYRGQLVELGQADQICKAPSHPYTKTLVTSVPGPHRKSHALAGMSPIPVVSPS